jgi:hypothetical protein
MEVKLVGCIVCTLSYPGNPNNFPVYTIGDMGSCVLRLDDDNGESFALESLKLEEETTHEPSRRICALFLTVHVLDKDLVLEFYWSLLQVRLWPYHSSWNLNVLKYCNCKEYSVYY